jgi:hypothetical protein
MRGRWWAESSESSCSHLSSMATWWIHHQRKGCSWCRTQSPQINQPEWTALRNKKVRLIPEWLDPRASVPKSALKGNKHVASHKKTLEQAALHDKVASTLPSASWGNPACWHCLLPGKSLILLHTVRAGKPCGRGSSTFKLAWPSKALGHSMITKPILQRLGAYFSLEQFNTASSLCCFVKPNSHVQDQEKTKLETSDVLGECGQAQECLCTHGKLSKGNANCKSVLWALLQMDTIFSPDSFLPCDSVFS